MPNEVATPVAAPAPAAPAQGQPSAPQNTPPPGGKEGAPAAAAVAKPAAPELHEVKVNGQLRRMTLDQLKAEASKGYAANERFEQAAAKERAAEGYRKGLTTEPIRALQEAGLSPDQIREHFENWYNENIIKPSTMTKEQKQAEEWRKKAEEYEQKQAAEKEAQENEAREKYDNAVRDQVQSELIECIEKSGLPKTRFTMHRIAYWTQQNIRKGYNAPIDVIVQQVKDEYLDVNKSAAQAHMGDPEKFVEWIVATYGEDAIKAIRKYDLKRLKTKFGQTPEGQDPEQPTRKPGEKKSMREVDQYFNNLRRSK